MNERRKEPRPVFVRTCIAPDCEKTFDQAQATCKRQVCPYVEVKVLDMTDKQFKRSFGDTQPIPFDEYPASSAETNRGLV